MPNGLTPGARIYIRDLEEVPPLLRGQYGHVVRPYMTGEAHGKPGEWFIEPMNFVERTLQWLPATWLEPLAPDTEARWLYVLTGGKDMPPLQNVIAVCRQSWREWTEFMKEFGLKGVNQSWKAQSFEDIIAIRVRQDGCQITKDGYVETRRRWDQLAYAYQRLARALEQQVGA